MVFIKKNNNYTRLIKDFSTLKKEPDWMLYKRQDSLIKIEQLKLPLIERTNYDRWPLFNISEEIYSSEYVFESITSNYITSDSLLIQYGGVNLFKQLPKKLVDKGVIFTDLFSAMQKYPHLVEKYYMHKTESIDENKITAIHASFMNSGLFLYVPEDVEIEEPIQAICYQDGNSNIHFFNHILIIAEKNSKFNYLERTITVGSKAKKISGNVFVELIAKSGAKVDYSAIDELGPNTSNYVTRRSVIMKDASVNWNLGIMNSGNTVFDFDSDLLGTGCSTKIKAVSISSGFQTQVIDTYINNKSPYSTGHILQHGVANERGKLIFNGVGHISKGAVGSDSKQESRILMLSDKARGDTNPILLIDENNVTAGHAASVGRLNEDEMYYLMSRGLNKKKAQSLVIRGFLNSILNSIKSTTFNNKLRKVIERKLKE